MRYAQKCVVDCKPLAVGEHVRVPLINNDEPEFVLVYVFSVIVRSAKAYIVLEPTLVRPVEQPRILFFGRLRDVLHVDHLIVIPRLRGQFRAALKAGYGRFVDPVRRHLLYPPDVTAARGI